MYDLAIIGSGPGGYVAALYASARSLKVCVIDKGLVGGTCLNRGCIPTKALLSSASVALTVKDAGHFGVKVDGYSVDFQSMMSRKADIVNRLRAGIETLFRARKVDFKRGFARVAAPGVVAIDGSGSVTASGIIIATGSEPAAIKGIAIDEKSILSSDGMLELSEIPGSLAIVGGGAVGCEFAHLFSALGSKVSVIEMTDRLVPTQSSEASRKLESIFRRNGIDIRLNAQVGSVTVSGGRARVALSDSSAIEADKVLVSVGRRPCIDGIADGAGVTSKGGRIAVNDRLETAAKGIYAIGDCVPGPQLAHKASYDAMVACDNFMGADRKVDYSAIPSAIWTEPEIASVGLSDDEAKRSNPDAKVAKFPYLASGKAYIERKTEGYVKIVGTASGRLLGVEIMGREACDLIGEAAVAMKAGMTVRDWSLAVRAHPTLSETLQEAANAFCGHSIHTI